MQKENKVFTDEQKLRFVQEWLNTDISLKVTRPNFCL